MTREEAVALLERYSNYDGMGIPNLAGCKEAMKVAVDALKEAFPELAESEDERIMSRIIDGFKNFSRSASKWNNIPIEEVIVYLEKQKEQRTAESISQLTVQGKGVYKICPRCKERMVRDDSMVYTSMPPQYRYECPKCGESECDTVMYDNPEMEEQKPWKVGANAYFTPEQKPIAESKRLANEVIEYLTRCGFSPVLKDDSKKEHFHIDIPRHEDDFWLSEEYKHCRSVLGEYYMEGDYGGDTYTLYIWREKKEQKPAEHKAFEEWAEDYWSHNKVNNPYSYNKGDEIQFDHKGFVSFCEAYCYPQNLVLHDTFGYEEGRQTGRNEGVKLVLNNPEKYGLQKEQKSAEWSEEDETRLTNILIMLQEYVIHHYSKDDVDKSVDWLKNKVKFLRPQKPDASKLENFDPVDVLNRIKTEWPMAWEKVVGKQEWDEFDEDCLKRAIWYVENPAPSVVKDTNLALWLKSLRPQYHGDVTMTEAYKMGLEAGKASSWKPSQEQLYALLNAEGFLRAGLQYNSAKTIAELYEQLKKL